MTAVTEKTVIAAALQLADRLQRESRA